MLTALLIMFLLALALGAHLADRRIARSAR